MRGRRGGGRGREGKDRWVGDRGGKGEVGEEKRIGRKERTVRGGRRGSWKAKPLV